MFGHFFIGGFMNNNSVIKNFYKYVSLNVIGMIGISLYVLADTFFVAKALGSNGLAALNFSISIYCIVNGVGLMLGIGGATKYTVLKSQGNQHEANSVFTNTVKLGIVLGVMFAVIGIFFATPIARLLGADQNTVGMTTTYLTTILCFAPAFIMNNVILAFIRNDGNPKLSMAGMILGSLSNIVLDYVFVFPLSMGMFGAAFATGLAPIISIGLLSLHFIYKNNSFSLVRCKTKIKHICDIISLGVSAFISEVSSGVVLIVFNLVIFSIEGNIGVAAYGVVANLALVVIAMFTGVAQGVQPIASHYYAMKKPDLAKKVLKYAIYLSLCIATVIYAVTFICSSGLIAVFNSENNIKLAELATNGIRIYFVGFLFAGINIIVAAFFSATEKPKKAFVISISRGIVAVIPFVFILSTLFEMNGVWLAFVATELATCIITVIYLVKDNSKHINNR